MKRRLLKFAAITSLLVCATSGVYVAFLLLLLMSGDPLHGTIVVALEMGTGFTFLFGVVSWLLIRQTVRAVRPTTDECCACGYNAGSTICGVCPECGNPIPQMTESAL